MNFNEAKQIVIKKFKYICIVGLICAIIAGGYKYCFTPSFSYKGDFQYTRIIQVVNDKEMPNTHFELNYSGVINTNGCYVAFFETAENVYDFAKINSSWGGFNKQDKIKWFRRLVGFSNFHNNTYEIVFTISPNSITDLSYLNENISGLMDLFVKQGNQLIRNLKPGTEIKTIGETLLVPKRISYDKKANALNYSGYGFIAGIFLSVAFFIGKPLFEKIQD